MKKTGILLLCLTITVLAQSNSETKRKDFERRFKEAVHAIDTQDYQTARKICDGIIKEEPKARGSLLIAGMASLELFEPAKAIEYLDAFRKLEPLDPQGIMLAIEANQEDKRTAKVEALLKELYELRKTNAKLQSTENFIRERFKSSDNRLVVIREYFDCKIPPYKVWEVSEVNIKTNEKTRSLDFSYNVGASEVAKEGENYFLGETVIKNSQPLQINIYREEKNRPEYSVFRKWITDTIKQPPTPIYSAPLQPKP
jgi:tetratricopeptide (TPR) repeat protein